MQDRVVDDLPRSLDEMFVEITKRTAYSKRWPHRTEDNSNDHAGEVGGSRDASRPSGGDCGQAEG